jgi:hypothetical protein
VTRLWILTAVLFALALASCGPDCDAFCNKLQQCESVGGPHVELSRCILGCNEAGGDQAHTIQCYVDHTCTDIVKGGHCSVTGQPPFQ